MWQVASQGDASDTWRPQAGCTIGVEAGHVHRALGLIKLVQRDTRLQVPHPAKQGGMWSG